MRNLLILLVLAIGISCQKQEVQLTKLDLPGETEVFNTSNIWFFYETANGETRAKINTNNKIANTHIIFNVDKRLKLKHIIPDVIELQSKLRKRTIHSDGNMNNYFNYADTLNNTFSLHDFTHTKFVILQSRSLLDLQGDVSLIVGEENFKLNRRNEEFHFEALEDIDLRLVNPSQDTLSLIYSDELLFERYLKTSVWLKNQELKVYDVEFIYAEE